MIASRKSIIVTKPERTACSLADLSEENAMILDNLEEYEEVVHALHLARIVAGGDGALVPAAHAADI